MECDGGKSQRSEEADGNPNTNAHNIRHGDFSLIVAVSYKIAVVASIVCEDGTRSQAAKWFPKSWRQSSLRRSSRYNPAMRSSDKLYGFELKRRDNLLRHSRQIHRASGKGFNFQAQGNLESPAK